MAFATWEDLFRKKPEVVEGMEDVARQSFPNKLPTDYPEGLTAAQIDAINADPKLNQSLNQGLSQKAPVVEPVMAGVKPTHADNFGTLVGGPRTPDEILPPATTGSRELVPVSKTRDIVTTAKTIPFDEATRMDKIMEYVKNSKAAQVAGKLAKPIAGIGTAMSVGSGIQNVKEGEYGNALGDTAGVGSGIAALTGHPAASLALGATDLGIKGGMSMGKRQAETGVDENGYNFDPNVGVPSDSPAPIMLGQNKSTEQLPGPLQGPYDPNRVPPPVPAAAPATGPTPSKVSAPRESSEPDYRKMYQGLLDISNEGSINTVAKMKEVQDKANRDKGIADFAKGANLVQSGALGLSKHTKAPDISTANEIQDGFKKTADDKVKQYKDLTDQEKNDPNSPASQRMRSIAEPMLAKLGMKLPNTMSFNEVEKNFPMFTKMFDSHERSQDRKTLAREKALDRKQASVDADTKGEVASDRDYAKKYNEWTGGDRNKGVQAVQKLEEIASQMEKDTGPIQSGGGRAAAFLHDSLRDRSAIQRRDLAHQTAYDALKATFPGNISDGERKALAETYYNDKLDNKANAKMMRQKIQTIKNNINDADKKASYFEKNKKSLKGFTYSKDSPYSPISDEKSKAGTIVNIKGKRYRVGSDGDSLEEI